MKTYGIPYCGSKDKIAEKILSLFPSKDNFYDLFMGGGAITHCALTQNNFKNYYANDLNNLVAKAFKMAINGDFKNETRWINHEEFNKLKDVDPYVACCFSFGNDFQSYAYGKEIESYKKALHYAIVFQDYALMNEIFPNIDFTFLNNIKDVNERRLSLKQFLDNNGLIKDDNRLRSNESLQSLIQLESVQRLESVKRLEIFSASYDEIKIKSNSIIYCDIPYSNTKMYSSSKKFDYEKFYDWCGKQTELCFISEYQIPSDRFTCIAEFEHRSIICATENQSVIERVFLPNHQVKNYKIPSLFDL